MDLRPGLSAITCPALVLAGADDPTTPPAFTDVIAAGLGGPVTHRTYGDCGHGVLTDRPRAGLAAIRACVAAQA